MNSCSLAHLIEERACKTPDLPFLLDNAGTVLSFGSYRELVARLAGWLSSIGVQREMLVTWQLPTSFDAVILAGALAWLGARQNPVLPLYRRRELSSVVTECEPGLLIARSRWHGVDGVQIAQAAAEALEKNKPGRRSRVLVLDSLPSLSATPSPRPIDRDTAAASWIFYTSGTTSAPKGALHTDASLAAGATGLVQRYAVTAEDRYAMVFPFTHVGGIQMLFIQMMTGASGVLFERFEGDASFEVMREMGVTLLSGGTPLVQLALEAQRKQPGRALLPKLRLAMTGAAPKTPRLHREVQEELGGVGTVSCYGLTEAPMAVLSSISDGDEKLADTEGRPINGCQVRIANNIGADCAVDELGEILIRGPQMMAGYVNPRAAPEAFDQQGYFRTGDIGMLDAEGYVRVVGRLKDIIIRKGEKISAAEVEEVLGRHPAIAEVAAIALPGGAAGECCCAVATLRDVATPISLSDLATFCRAEGLATFKIPERLEIIEAMPRNPSGKILKPNLVERFATTGCDT